MSDDASNAAGPDGTDGDIPSSAAYRVALPEFEGPLDLLLHLCKTHAINIVDIQISFITEKYLEYLETMQTLSVEIAAEYLVMAATLAYLKSRELVPNPEPIEAIAEDGSEEALDPKEELIRRLLEYQKYKDAAAQLGDRPVEGRNVFGRGVTIEGRDVDAGLAEHSVWKLIAAFGDILKKAEPKATHNVHFDRQSVTERIAQLVDKMKAAGGTVRFDTLIDLDAGEVEVRHQLVVTLLAILELAKSKLIRVLQDPVTEVFFIAQREGASLDEALRVKITSDDSMETEAALTTPPEQSDGEAQEG